MGCEMWLCFVLGMVSSRCFCALKGGKNSWNHSLTVLKSNIPGTIDRTEDVGISSISSGSLLLKFPDLKVPFKNV